MSRYISNNEAVWRILSFPIHERHPTVDDPFAKTLLFSEVPTYYTWNASSKNFQRRKQGKRVEGHSELFSTDALGRIYRVHPNNAECFYLRLLLVNVLGPTSFQNLNS